MSWDLDENECVETMDSGEWSMTDDASTITVKLRCPWNNREKIARYLTGRLAKSGPASNKSPTFWKRYRHPWNRDYACSSVNIIGEEKTTQQETNGTVKYEIAIITAVFTLLPPDGQYPDIDFQIDHAEEFIMLPAGTKSKTSNIRSQGNDYLIFPVITYRVLRWVPHQYMNMVSAGTSYWPNFVGKVNSDSIYLPFTTYAAKTCMFSGYSLERKWKYGSVGYLVTMVFKIKQRYLGSTLFHWQKKVDQNSSGELVLGEFAVDPYAEVAMSAGGNTTCYSITSFIQMRDEELLAKVQPGD